MIKRVNLNRALDDIKRLTGEVPLCMEGECYTIKDRGTGRIGLKWAKRYVFAELVRLGYSVEYRDWSRSGYSDQNILARKPGMTHPEENIYFVAHLDGEKSSSNERRPAADDNASGVVDILELARALNDYSFDRSLVLLISTGEERNTLGVQSYLSQLSPAELDTIKYVINIDMVSYDGNQDKVMELWHADHFPSMDLVYQMGEIIRAYKIDLVPVYLEGCG